MSKKQRRLERIIANTERIEALGFDLHYFSDIHVRIDNRVDFWLSTGNWHLKGQKKEGKSFNEMVNYLKGDDVDSKISFMGSPVVYEDNPTLMDEPVVFGDLKESCRERLDITISPLFITNLIKAHLRSCDEDFSNHSSDVIDSLVDMGMTFDDALRLVDAMYTKEND